MAVLVKGKNARKPYTIRYWVAGKQREKSFTHATDAREFKIKVEHDTRTQTFIDPSLGSVRFADYALSWLDGRVCAKLSKKAYGSVLRTWIIPWASDRTLRQVANDREGATDLLNRRMANGNGELLSYSRRDTARMVLVSVMNEAVRAGRIESHRLSEIRLVKPDEASRKSFVFPTYKQIAELDRLLEDFGPVIWLMRGCGLRISEALAVHREDFSKDGSTLRLIGQPSLSGRTKRIPLKHRKPGEYRDIPVPGYLWDLVKEKPPGPVCPAPGGSYFPYNTFLHRFDRAKVKAGIPEGFVSHSLRHAFASALLANGVPITDVAVWLGHRNISVTYSIYAHLIPSAVIRARNVLDDEFESWRLDSDNPGSLN